MDRINKELDGDFDLNQFKHQPEYNENDGIAKSYIQSTTDQSVFIKSIDKTFHFTTGEKIHTEISRKYNDELIKTIIEKSDFMIGTKILDSKGYFADYILIRQ